MKHDDLTQVLWRSWRAMPPDMAENTPFRVADKAGSEPVYRCPDCLQTMEKYGYMGMRAVQIDRCEKCGVVWLDADELQNMVLALAKYNYRGERAVQEAQRRRVSIVPVGEGPVTAQKEHEEVDWLFGEGTEAVVAQVLLRLLLR